MNLLNGSSYILWIDTTTPLTAERGLDYRPIVCLTSNDFGMDVDPISTRNKCDGGYDSSMPGYLSWNFSGDGFAIGLKQADKLAKANFQELALLVRNKITFWCKMDDVQGSITREGKVWITSYRETQGMDTPFSFTANFTGVGKPILEESIYKTVLGKSNTQLITDGNNNLIEVK